MLTIQAVQQKAHTEQMASLAMITSELQNQKEDLQKLKVQQGVLQVPLSGSNRIHPETHLSNVQVASQVTQSSTFA